jgi:hypothetical protein
MRISDALMMAGYVDRGSRGMNRTERKGAQQMVSANIRTLFFQPEAESARST